MSSQQTIKASAVARTPAGLELRAGTGDVELKAPTVAACHYNHGFCDCHEFLTDDPPPFDENTSAPYALVVFGDDGPVDARQDSHVGRVLRKQPDKVREACLIANTTCPLYTEDVVGFLDRLALTGTEDPCANCPVHFAAIQLPGEAHLRTVPMADSAVRLFMEMNGIPARHDECWQSTLAQARRSRPELHGLMAHLHVRPDHLFVTLCCIDCLCPDLDARLADAYMNNPVRTYGGETGNHAQG